jgi:hypothetical protein
MVTALVALLVTAAQELHQVLVVLLKPTLEVVVGGHTLPERRVLVEPGAVVLVVKIRQTPLQLLELQTLVAAEAAAVLVVAQAQQEALV